MCCSSQYIFSNDHTYLVDVHGLGEATFSTRSHGKKTLREIMESRTVPTLFIFIFIFLMCGMTRTRYIATLGLASMDSMILVNGAFHRSPPKEVCQQFANVHPDGSPNDRCTAAHLEGD
jgi:hypothetical protein